MNLLGVSNYASSSIEGSNAKMMVVGSHAAKKEASSMFKRVQSAVQRRPETPAGLNVQTQPSFSKQLNLQPQMSDLTSPRAGVAFSRTGTTQVSNKTPSTTSGFGTNAQRIPSSQGHTQQLFARSGDFGTLTNFKSSCQVGIRSSGFLQATQSAKPVFAGNTRFNDKRQSSSKHLQPKKKPSVNRSNKLPPTQRRITS